MHCPTLRALCVLLFISLAAGASAQQPASSNARASAIAPYLDDQTVAVGRLDLGKLDVAAVMKFVQDLAPQPEAEFQRQLALARQAATGMLMTLKEAGIEELYVVVSLADVPQGPPLVVAPVAAGKSAADAATKLSDILPRRPEQVVEAVGQAVVLANQESIDRLKTLQPTPRPEFARALSEAGDTTAQLVFAPNADTRRVLREMLPRLPDEIGGGSGRMLADGVQWAVLSFGAPPKLSLRLTIQSKDAESAAAVRGMIVSSLQLLGQQPEVREELPKFDELARILTPQLRGDRLIIELSEANGGVAQVAELLTRPVLAARQAARHSQSMNNLKQIGLALHNYHDVYGRFPPQAIRDKDGKPLLSWRVAILPFVDAHPLFKEFRLDEPWDSEHNLKLAERMPAVFASPALGDEQRRKGMTAYLAPLSRAVPATFVPPPAGAAPERKKDERLTVFDNPGGVHIRDITDGTSNTIAVVEAPPKQAVIWTKPDDLVFDEDDPLALLRGQADKGFNTLFCDGSARFLSDMVDPQILRLLLWMNDGQAVGTF